MDLALFYAIKHIDKLMDVQPGRPYYQRFSSEEGYRNVEVLWTDGHRSRVRYDGHEQVRMVHNQWIQHNATDMMVLFELIRSQYHMAHSLGILGVLSPRFPTEEYANKEVVIIQSHAPDVRHNKIVVYLTADGHVGTCNIGYVDFSAYFPPIH